jgi:subtilase family serine protease
MIGIAALAACSGGSMNSMLPAGQGASPASLRSDLSIPGKNYRHVCGRQGPGEWARCFALVRTDVGGIPGGYHGQFGAFATSDDLRINPDAAHATPAGYGPAQLVKAYSLPTSGGTGQTVALVEVGDYPTAAADLTTYRSQYGLSSCTTANGCFKKVSQTGSTTSLPKTNAGWAEETALDMDMVSATCPNCHILIVEATSASDANLNTAENEAATLKATVISNSYGGSESGSSNSAYSHAGIVITASAGDDGYAEGSQQPCSYQTVVCTGGSSLVAASGTRGYSETVWNDLAAGNGATGSGCSSDVAKPSWQTDKGCTKRSQSDVSFDADPENGVAIYDSTTYEGYVGWLEFGGTSVAAPALAGVYGLAGNAATLSTTAAKSFWTNAGKGLYSVTSGNNLAKGKKCGSAYAYICTAGTNTDGVYSGPTGWGTPDGISDF